MMQPGLLYCLFIVHPLGFRVKGHWLGILWNNKCTTLPIPTLNVSPTAVYVLGREACGQLLCWFIPFCRCWCVRDPTNLSTFPSVSLYILMKGLLFLVPLYCVICWYVASSSNVESEFNCILVHGIDPKSSESHFNRHNMWYYAWCLAPTEQPNYQFWYCYTTDMNWTQWDSPQKYRINGLLLIRWIAI